MIERVAFTHGGAMAEDPATPDSMTYGFDVVFQLLVGLVLRAQINRVRGLSAAAGVRVQPGLLRAGAEGAERAHVVVRADRITSRVLHAQSH